MRQPEWWSYVAVFAAALGGGLLCTPLARRTARRFAIADAPGGRKAHVEPVSLLGGLAIYAGAFAAVWSLAPGARPELKGFALAGLVVLLFGLADDLNAMDPWLKLLAQIASALVLVGFGVQVTLTHVAVVDVAITVAWVVAVINAVNYSDNMNGLASGLAAVSSAGMFVLALSEQQWLVALVAVALAGGSLGFLRSNYPAARIFMGDSGSMLLGLTLAFLAIRLRFFDQPKSTTFLIPALVLAVPLFDACLVTVSRRRRGVPVTQGGTDHTSHRLVRAGLPAWAAVAVLWLAQAACCLAAVAVARYGLGTDLAVIAAGVVAVAVAAMLLERALVRHPAPSAAASSS